MRDAVAGLRLAVGTFTMVPVGTLPPPTRRAAARSMALAPVAVLPLGLLAGAVVWFGARVGLPTLVTAALVVGALALGSRAMHLDGLADTADGIGAGWDRTRALEVMRSGDVGPMGASSLVVVLLVQSASIATLAALPHGGVLIGATVLASRAAATVGCVRGLPAAEGSRLGAVVAGTVPPGVAGAVVIAVGVTVVGASLVVGVPWWQSSVAIAVMVLAVGAVVRTAVRVFGGVNGDVFGAAIEVALAVLLVVLSAGGAR